MNTEIVSKYVREQQRYTQKELCDILECSADKVVPIIRKLKEFGVLKAVKATAWQKDMSELVEEDIEVSNVEAGEMENFYVFTFVGVIVVYGRVLKCYPKYILKNKNPEAELRQVLKVLEKYNSKEQIVHIFNASSESNSFNLLAVMLFLIKDYYENGIYTNTKYVIEHNGNGEILWDRTINETFMLLSDGRPYYVDLRTKKTVGDDFDYFKRLHECILSKISAEMQGADLLDIFELTEIELTDANLDEFGELDYILYRIENELNTQFNTRKQLVLKALYAYIANSGNLNDLDAFSLFGTNSFNLVWEYVCADIMDDQLNKRLGELKLPVQLNNSYNKDYRLIDLIEKPFWSATGKTASDTLIPDLITIKDGQFIIFDAKYYNAILESGRDPIGQPGIESVIKQYMYQLAYKNFIVDHNFQVKNCFLMPSENTSFGVKEKVEVKGEVSLNMLSGIGLKNILVRFIPAGIAYECYLSNQKMDISDLKL